MVEEEIQGLSKLKKVYLQIGKMFILHSDFHSYLMYVKTRMQCISFNEFSCLFVSNPIPIYQQQIDNYSLSNMSTEKAAEFDTFPGKKQAFKAYVTLLSHVIYVQGSMTLNYVKL